MKTTLVIDDHIFLQLKQEAARQGRTMSELVESALRLLLTKKRPDGGELPPLPTFSSEMLVDISDREALYEVMGGRW